MTPRPELIELHAMPHPVPALRRSGFALDHPYLEQCWGPLIGPSSVALLRHCGARLADAGGPLRVSAAELAAQLGRKPGRGAHSPLWHNVDRLVRFKFAFTSDDHARLGVYTSIAAVPGYVLHRLPAWSRQRHRQLLAAHLEQVATEDLRAQWRVLAPAEADALLAAHPTLAERIAPEAASRAADPGPGVGPPAAGAEPAEVRMARRLDQLGTNRAGPASLGR
ncbi:MAG: hypothetical protein ACLGIO_06185 [Acidimicrobiia bacterium]